MASSLFSSAVATLAVAIVATSSQADAAYTLKDSFLPDNFFSGFDFFTAADPTHGQVQYVSQADAQQGGFLSTGADSVKFGADSTTTLASGQPRKSTRIVSKDSYGVGSLIVLDVAHMPQGCGTWPAFWTVGPNWPAGGEIDIIEGVNTDTTNSATLHTSPGCTINNSGAFSGQVAVTNCDATLNSNEGCGIKASSDSSSYGAGLNAVQGGVYAMEWVTSGITVWYFPRSSIPSDVSSASPDTASWPEPQAKFTGSCDFDTFFTAQQIVINTDIGGDWTSGDYPNTSCPSQYGTLDNLVTQHPAAFADAYWEINSLKVYSSDGSSSAPPASSAAAPPPSATPASQTQAPASTLATSVSASTQAAPPAGSNTSRRGSHTHGAGRPTRTAVGQPGTTAVADKGVVNSNVQIAPSSTAIPVDAPTSTLPAAVAAATPQEAGAVIVGNGGYLSEYPGRLVKRDAEAGKQDFQATRVRHVRRHLVKLQEAI